MIKKCMLLFMLCILCVTNDVCSDERIKWGVSKHCIVEMVDGYDGSLSSVFMSQVKNVWYCGSQSIQCAGFTPWLADLRKWKYRGGSAQISGNTYWCCATESDGEGIWVKADSWLNADGTNVCGDKVDCEQTAFQGTALKSDGTSYCLKCDQSTEFFKNGKCVKKTSLTKLTFTNQADCFACENPSDMKKCLKKKAGGAESGVVTDCTSYVGGVTLKSILQLKKPLAIQNKMKLNANTLMKVNSNINTQVANKSYSVASGI